MTPHDLSPHNTSSCHLVDLTAAVVTSLMRIWLRTFFSHALIFAEMLIIRTCPVLWNTTWRFWCFTIWEFSLLMIIVPAFTGLCWRQTVNLTEKKCWTVLCTNESMFKEAVKQLLLYVHIFSCTHERDPSSPICCWDFITPPARLLIRRQKSALIHQV